MADKNPPGVEPTAPFDRDRMASWYAKRHLKIDPDVEAIYYLPNGAPGNEIRLLEVNPHLPTLTGDTLEPIDFGVDVGAAEGHRLLILDVTPSQWRAIQKNNLPLPAGWELDGSKVFKRGTR
jgi:hypothetical protein